jgi:hypothetical protein
MVYGSLHNHRTNFSTSTWQVQRKIKSSSFNIRRTSLSAECGIITNYRPDTAHFIAKICAESKKDGEVTTTQTYKQNVHGFKFQVATIHFEQGLPWGSLLCIQAK